MLCFFIQLKAFLFEEGGAASAVTEGAAREQICFRVNLIRILSIWKNSLSLAATRQSSSLNEGAGLALPLGELSFALQMTERADLTGSYQANLRELRACTSPLYRCATSLPKGEPSLVYA